MRIALTAALAAALGVPALTAGAGEVDQSLQNLVATMRATDDISVLVFLNANEDMVALTEPMRQARMPLADQHHFVVTTLQDTAAETQGELIALLDAMTDEGTVSNYQAFWITNAIRVDTTVGMIDDLAAHPDVFRVYYNPEIEGIKPVVVNEPNEPGMVAGGVEPGVAAVRAPEAWAAGIDGTGALVSSLDTGVSGNHPAVGSRWRGHDPAYAGNPDWAWFDPVTDTTFPQQWGNHGTHTMGTAVGGLPGDQVGVAPGAEWIHAGVIDRVSIQQTVADAILSFQWVADPDGNPNTHFDVPDVCFNSWGVTTGHGYPNCDDLFWSYIDNAEAAGVIMIFAAGNEGTSGLRRPADRATDEYRSMAIAALDANNPSWPIAGFSSKGPTNCTPDGTPAIKPDIAGPGVDVRSSTGSSGYGFLSGTSMSTPHLGGVAALMRQACPDLSAFEIKQIMYDTAVDQGAAGKDNSFGHGMVDAFEAAMAAAGSCSFGIQVVSAIPAIVDAGESVSVTIKITPAQEQIVPGSEQMFLSTDGGPFVASQLTPLGDDLYEASIPGVNCDQTPEFYFQAEGDAGTIRTSPANAPSNVYTYDIGVIETQQVFDFSFSGSDVPPGWGATGLWKVTSQCPVSGDCTDGTWAYYGQTGACNYVTGGSNSGTLTSAPIEIPEIGNAGTATVTFCHNLDTESASSFDIATFSVVGGQSHTLGNSSSWTTQSFDISAHSGQTIKLQWHFDTVDGLFNDFHGWQIDNIQIEVETVSCEDAGTPGDLNGDDVVDGADLAILLGQWGPCSDCDDCSADLDGNCNVDGADLAMLLGHWS